MIGTEVMDSVRCSLSPKGFQGLLTALAKRNYYKENDYTDAIIINQLYAGIELEPAEIVAEISMFEKVC